MQILNTLGLSSLICGMGILTFLSILHEVTVQTAPRTRRAALVTGGGGRGDPAGLGIGWEGKMRTEN